MTTAEIATALINGAAADIWYDAAEYGTDAPDDPDRAAENVIEDTQAAMQAAATVLMAFPHAFEAIRARIQGEWDNPALMAFGPLGEMRDDILAIAELGQKGVPPHLWEAERAQ